MLRFGALQIAKAGDEIDIDLVQLLQLLQLGPSAPRRKRVRGRALQVCGTPCDVLFKQAQSPLPLRDAVVQRRDMQARRVGIETASRSVVAVMSSAARSCTSAPRVLRSLRFCAWTRRTAFDTSAATSRVSWISRWVSARSAAAAAKAKTNPIANAQCGALRRAPRHADPSCVRGGPDPCVAAKTTLRIRAPPNLRRAGPDSPAGVAVPLRSIQYFAGSGKPRADEGSDRAASRGRVGEAGPDTARDRRSVGDGAHPGRRSR
jgi:hypothetical protein